jgi:hypothetical protein
MFVHLCYDILHVFLPAGGLAFKRGSVTIELLVVFNGDMSILKQMREPVNTVTESAVEPGK